MYCHCFTGLFDTGVVMKRHFWQRYPWQMICQWKWKIMKSVFAVLGENERKWKAFFITVCENYDKWLIMKSLISDLSFVTFLAFHIILLSLLFDFALINRRWRALRKLYLWFLLFLFSKFLIHLRSEGFDLRLFRR